jgi:hypothetical protein
MQSIKENDFECEHRRKVSRNRHVRTDQHSEVASA